MIKFFRKIRYNLMEQNKTGKYFKYALGEIVLVVIGILIALSINNWNEKRKEQNLEIRYIIELRSDLQKDSIAIANMITISNEQVRSKALLLKFLDDETDYELESAFVEIYQKFNYVPESVADSIVYHFNQQWRPHYNFAANKTTFDEMTSTGNIGVISNRSLRLLILETFNGYELHKLNREIIYKRQQEEIWKLIFQKIPRLYHLNNSDILSILENPELVNRLEGNYATGMNDALLELQTINKKLLDQLNAVM